MKRIRRAVFIVTYANSGGEIKYLILKRKLHWKGWEFPKGGVKTFELRKNAVKRELEEETGLKPLKIIAFKERGSYRYNKTHLDRRGITGQDYKLYSAEVKYSRKIKLDKTEHSSFEWKNFEGAIKKLTWSNQKRCLKIVDRFLKRKTNKN